MAREYDHLFKLIIIGEYGVGKTSLVLRFTENVFRGTCTTILASFLNRTINVNGERVRLQIWDAAGGERFHTLGPMYLRGTHGAVGVYDVTNKESFVKVWNWLHQVDSSSNVINRVLVGSKNDDPSRKVVMTEDAEAIAQEKGMMFFETSAKENLIVEEMFLAITEQMLQTKKEQQKKEAEQPSATVSLADERSGGKKYYCF